MDGPPVTIVKLPQCVAKYLEASARPAYSRYVQMFPISHAEKSPTYIYSLEFNNSYTEMVTGFMKNK